MKFLGAGVIFCLFLAGCAGTPGASPPSVPDNSSGEAGQPVSFEQALVAAQTPPDPEAVVARVNGRDITRRDMLDVLWPGRGPLILEELILLEVVRQRAAEQNIKASKAMVGEELERMLEDMAPGKDRRAKDALLDFMLRNRHLTRVEFDLILEREALLRRLIDSQVAVSEGMIAAEYQRQHGRRVEVRQIVLSNLRRVETVRRRLDQGENFTQLVQQMSEDEVSLARSGLTGPFSAADEQIPGAIRQAAMQLEYPGQRSDPIRYVDQNGLEWWALLQLERVIPADNAPLASVRGELVNILQEREKRRRMLELQRQLRRQGQVEILDPLLR